MIRKDNFTLPGAKGRPMLIDVTYDDVFKNAPLVVFAHGFKGFKDWGTHDLLARYFAEKGFRFLKFNFSHNGTTPANPLDFADLTAFADNTVSIELEDLDTIIDFACSGASMPVANGVYLIGHSMGGGVSIIKTAEDARIKKAGDYGFNIRFPEPLAKANRAAMALAGRFYFENKRTGQQMPVKSTLLDDLDDHPLRLDIIRQASLITQPWLIIHGDADPTVPVSHSNQLHEANPAAEYIVQKGADHTFGGGHPFAGDALPASLIEFCDMAISFLSK